MTAGLMSPVRSRAARPRNNKDVHCAANKSMVTGAERKRCFSQARPGHRFSSATSHLLIFRPPCVDRHRDLLSIVIGIVFAALFGVSPLVASVSGADAPERRSYKDKNGVVHELEFIRCPADPSSAKSPTFLIARHELSVEHYERVVELSKSSDGLPNLDKLCERIVELMAVQTNKSDSPKKRDEKLEDKKALGRILNEYKSNVRLPIFALTAEEADAVCNVLTRNMVGALSSQSSSPEGFISQRMSVPTVLQWRSACRRHSDISATPQRFVAWPKQQDVDDIMKSSENAKALQGKATKFARPFVDSTITTIDMTSEEVVYDLMETYEAADQANKAKKPTFEFPPGMTKTLSDDMRAKIIDAVTKDILTCYLREVLRCAVAEGGQVDRSNLPLSLGLKGNDTSPNFKDCKKLSKTKRVDKKLTSPPIEMLREVDDAASLPNLLEIKQLAGNVTEWVKHDGATAVAGAGVFDEIDWRKALINHFVKIEHKKGDTRSKRDGEEHKKFAGVRLVLEEALNPNYRRLLAAALRRVLDLPATERVAMIEKERKRIDDALKKVRANPGDAEYQDAMPAFELVRDFLVLDESPDGRAKRANSAGALGDSEHLSKATKQSSVLNDEKAAAWKALALAEKPRAK